MTQYMTGERTTALVSATLALAILAAMGTADAPRTESRDLAAILESDLRFQLELSWRRNPRVLKERLADLDRTLAAWSGSPRTGADRELLIAWLDESIKRSMPGRDGQLPPTPQFSQPPAKETRQDIQVTRSPADDKPAEPALDARRPPSVALATPPIGESPDVAEPVAPHVTPAVAAPSDAASKGRGEQSRLSQNTSDPPRGVPHVAAKPPASAAPPANQSSYAEAAAPRPTPPAEPTAAVEPQPGPSAAEAPIEAPSIAARPTVSPPHAAVTEATSSRATAPVRQASTASRGTQAPDVRPVGSSPSTVAVNLVELNARIGGYHDGLDEVSAALMADGALNVPRLTRLVGELEALSSQFGFIKLYYDALTDRERQFVVEPRDLGPTIELAEQRRAALESTATDFLGSAGRAEPSELAQRLMKLRGSRE